MRVFMFVPSDTSSLASGPVEPIPTWPEEFMYIRYVAAVLSHIPKAPLAFTPSEYLFAPVPVLSIEIHGRFPVS